MSRAAALGAGWAAAGLPPAWARAQEVAAAPATELDLAVARTPFTVEGRRAGATTINGGVPGPLLRWREGDEVALRVANMQDLLARLDEPPAAEAVELFCSQARQRLAALTAVLGGVDRLVFTGGIGANAPSIRAKICDGLGYLGVSLDAERNAAGAQVISPDAGRVAVEAFATDEELVIARHVRAALAASVAEEA